MGGRAVRLVKGDPATARDFGDPLSAAERWVAQGASWLHVVDLDAAFGEGDNLAIIADLVASVNALVEVSGGIRSDGSLQRVLDTGCAQVSIGTAALEQPDWCRGVLERWADQVSISLDVHGEALASHGWREASGSVYDTLAAMSEAGCQRFIVTDTAMDGTLNGPNLELLGACCARTDAAIVASGGISTLEQIRQLRGLTPIGVSGAIIGTALYLEQLSLPQALEIAGTE